MVKFGKVRTSFNLSTSLLSKKKQSVFALSLKLEQHLCGISTESLRTGLVVAVFIFSQFLIVIQPSNNVCGGFDCFNLITACSVLVQLLSWLAYSLYSASRALNLRCSLGTALPLVGYIMCFAGCRGFRVIHSGENCFPKFCMLPRLNQDFLLSNGIL